MPNITLNIDKAKDIWKDKIRQARKAELESLDVAYMRALESGDLAKQAEIVARKNELRNATDDPALVVASTHEEIKAVQPAGLEIK